jgi:hypothetical protein
MWFFFPVDAQPRVLPAPCTTNWALHIGQFSPMTPRLSKRRVTMQLCSSVKSVYLNSIGAGFIHMLFRRPGSWTEPPCPQPQVPGVCHSPATVEPRTLRRGLSNPVLTCPSSHRLCTLKTRAPECRKAWKQDRLRVCSDSTAGRVSQVLDQIIAPQQADRGTGTRTDQ